MRVTSVLLHCCFSARKEFQISCPCPYTRVSLGCQNILILVSSSKRMCKLCLMSPSLSFLKEGSQAKEVARRRLHTFWYFTRKYRLCLWMRSHYQAQVSLLKMCQLLDQGARVFSHIGYHFKLLSNGSSIFNVPRTSWYEWHRKGILNNYSWFNGDSEHLKVSPSQQVSFVEGSSLLGICYFYW